jgi:hypothetical protein
MSKLVNWGRWPIAAILALCGFAYLSDTIFSDVTNGFYGRETFYPVYMKVLWSFPFLMGAWGILTWRSWARGLAILLCTVEVAGFGILGTIGIRHPIDGGELVALMLTCTPPIWAMLPSVRDEYKRRDQTA